MAKSKHTSVAVRFPIKGIEKRWGYQGQGPFTTVDCNNIWPTQWSTGRERGGTRPGLSPITVSVADRNPLNWCDATWENNETAFRGVATVSRIGYRVSFSSGGNTYNKAEGRLGTNDFRSCSVYLQHLFIASGGRKGITVVKLSESASDLDIQNPLKSAEIFDDDGESFTTKIYKGTPPEKCGLVQTWGDRLVFAGDTAHPHIVYMCRIGAPDDWDYSKNDASAAWANSGGEDGKIGEPITALIPHNRDCLIIGCTDSMYIFRGNPRLNGQKYQLTSVIGPVMQSAWCKAGDDSTFFMSRDGLYMIRPGCGEPPVQVSGEIIPKDLKSIDPGSGDWVSIAYDTQWRGVHIYARRGSQDIAYFFDIQSGGFWPMTFSSHPRLAINYKSLTSEDKSGLVIVSSGGTSKQFSSAVPCEKDAYLYYGPFALGDPFTEGLVTEIASVLAGNSGNVKWSLHAGDSPELALADPTPFEGMTWKEQGLNYNQNPMRRGTTCYIKVYGDAGVQWAIEEIMMQTQLAGRRTVG